MIRTCDRYRETVPLLEVCLTNYTYLRYGLQAVISPLPVL